MPLVCHSNAAAHFARPTDNFAGLGREQLRPSQLMDCECRQWSAQAARARREPKTLPARARGPIWRGQ